MGVSLPSRRVIRVLSELIALHGCPSARAACRCLGDVCPKAEHPADYTLADHPNLAEDSPLGPIFDVFRQEVIALDSCVSEEIFKQYVAYKAETNFVDVVPQKNRLRLTLNLCFHELNDPRKLARDVTNLGRWGNGDVEVGLSQPGELPYVMGLVRQAFEKQMGNGEATA